MTVESIATLFVAMLISAAVPGPGVFTCIARARGLLRDRRARRRCNQGAGALMVGTGVYIAVRQT
ncbi:hypothetical protein VB780_02205 [Leptolyngbya sp. CCNP1308]|uniref:hypothetical protein n=1 Tax=Leptolyngbya sp. CCNP1308 TaxID=3110255 RepID=UPI002B202A6B|nr:hypothetical protein [Leptolyngbya sp. CCNP1308]MEA5447364.1 hypothetical protein [Leptolyngbya sp. CCNP1308]